MSLNDLESPIQLKVRYTDGTLDVVTYVLCSCFRNDHEP